MLVALGHLFQGINHLLPQQYIYEWFEQTIYYFHVQLFFICSGYLYQKRSVVNSFSAWKDNALKKLIALGIPYFTFSLVTWVLKNIFAGAVNNGTNSLVYDLFIVPQSPYWYLYALFFVFLIMPTFSDKKGYTVGLTITLGMKIANMVTGGIGIYPVDVVMHQAIWFVVGMSLCVFDVPAILRSSRWLRGLGAGLMLIFVLISLVISWIDLEIGVVSFGMGLLACIAVLMLFWSKKKEYSWTSKAVSYTMPVFLMHTIFAAGVRAVLLKLDIYNVAVHVVAGLAASFIGPIIATEVMQKLKLDILIYPTKYIRLPLKNGKCDFSK